VVTICDYSQQGYILCNKLRFGPYLIIVTFKNYVDIIITAMSDDNDKKSTPSWFFMREYPNPDSTASVEDTVQVDKVSTMLEHLTMQEAQICKLTQHVEDLEQKVIPTLGDMNAKLEKLIQSHRSLIDYFSAVNERDVRDLNYKIRGYSSKSKHLRPINFVPERYATDI
jgi:hypothetical protein